MAKSIVSALLYKFSNSQKQREIRFLIAVSECDTLDSTLEISLPTQQNNTFLN